LSETLQAVKPDPATSGKFRKETEVGSVFVSNYPAYSFWKPDYVAEFDKSLHSSPKLDVPMGLYFHIPFCRKRCKFCYFKVYTGKNSDEIQTYLDALAAEVELYAEMPAIINRPLNHIYFGGGTPSFISTKHLQSLVDRAKAAMPWENVEEVAFECEPGTLTQSKLETIKEIGVTRLSLGIENFNDEILQENGRAHLTKEIDRVKPWIKELGFDLLNIDLIAGMVGETWDTWKETVRKAIDYDADSITTYQMELPFNTVYSKQILDGKETQVVADWPTKWEWNDYAIEELTAAGYEISSAYTMVRKGKNRTFVYRDALWHGGDIVSTGVASFGHLSGVHVQNSSNWGEYIEKVGMGKLPLDRAFPTTERDRLTRELILQTKLGRVEPQYFQSKFNVNILSEFRPAYEKLRSEGMLDFNENEIKLTRKGLLRVDGLLPEFYEARYRNSRYT
jgi:oxygen-independent coproporphyrinogen-3 oxidase